MSVAKKLLLGSAACILAVTGAQAADLPLKAKAVEYVKVCSAFGAGFYYLPGTDTCLKVGGFLRMDVGLNAGGSHSPYIDGSNARDTREKADYQTRARGIMSWDARTQTEYGVLRAYVLAGFELNSGDANYRGRQYFDRAFIQFAGLTAGKAQSFFGFYNNARNYTTLIGGGQSDTGINLLAYTAQFGGGFTATISLEETRHRRGGIWDANADGDILTAGAIPGGGAPDYGDYRGSRYPDVVANFRVDQPWGSAHIAGNVHDASGLYHGPNSLGGSAGLNATGWAVTGGVKLILPWAQGDEFWIQGTYAKGNVNSLGFDPFVSVGAGGALMYSSFPSSIACGGAGTCGSTALVHTLDGVFNRANGMQLTEGWSILAALIHYWTPDHRTSFFGHYTALDYGAIGTAVYCAGPTGAGSGNVAAKPAICNPDLAIWQAGIRHVWSPVRNLDIGVEVLYTRVDQKHVGFWDLGANGSRAAGLYLASDQDTWSGIIRFQRNFWP